MDLAAMIRERGLKKGWIAEKIGVRAPEFSEMLTGKRPIPDPALPSLARVLRIRLADLRAIINNGGT
jgi:hypothetical protein